MAKRSLIVISFLSLILASALVQAQTFGAVLTPSQETPPATSNGFGNGTVSLDSTHTQLTVSITVAGLTTPIKDAHLHRGAFGVSGPVVVGFSGATNFVSGRLSSTLTIDKTLGDEIAGNPGNFYLNVHTNQYPGGEVRGQLTQIGDATLLFAELRGSNETPANGSTAVGAALITIDNNNLLTFEISAPAIQNPTAAHIHTGASGVSGPVLVGFTPAATFNNGRVRGTVQLSAQDAANIKANPAGFYVNVHTSSFGGGEIRGQMENANEYDVPIAGNVTTGAGDKFVTDLRIFNPSFTSKVVALVEYLVSGSGGNTNATASKTFEIPPRGQAVLDDVTGPNGLNAAGSTGALRVTSGNQLVVTANIYNDQRGANRGTFGQFVPAVSRATDLRRGIILHLANKNRDATKPSGFRTNVGFMNPNQSTVIVRLELRDASGTLLGQNTLALAPLSQQQNAITSYFPSADLSDSTGLTLSYDASAPIVAYGAVNDNASGDSIFVLAQPDPGVSSSQP
ncbi:MAG: hypothetical protein NVSMB68_00810 [Thermoanaerobaculia bacterium]